LLKDKGLRFTEKIKKLLLWSTIFTVAFLLQSIITIGDLKLNITVLLVYYFGFKGGESRGAAVGLPVGFVEDILSGTLIGPGMLGKGLVGVLSTFVSSGILIWTPLLGVVSVFILTFIDEAAVYASLSIFTEPPSSLQEFISVALLKSLSVSAAGAFIRPDYAK
jgi:rod shape-determining protein MreD